MAAILSCGGPQPSPQPLPAGGASAPPPAEHPPPVPEAKNQAYVPPPQLGAPYADTLSLTTTTGDIYTDKLFLGLKLMESSPVATSPQQAHDILAVIALLEAKLRKNEFYDQLLVQTLRPDQIRHVEGFADALTQGALHGKVNPRYMVQVVDELAQMAGQEVPEKPLAIPADIQPLPRPFKVSRMTLFMMAYESLQASSELAIDKEQARELLPFTAAYVNLKNMKQQTKRDILAKLDDEQKAFIDQHATHRTEHLLDISVLTYEVKALLEKKEATPQDD